MEWPAPPSGVVGSVPGLTGWPLSALRRSNRRRRGVGLHPAELASPSTARKAGIGPLGLGGLSAHLAIVALVVHHRYSHPSGKTLLVKKRSLRRSGKNRGLAISRSTR